MYIEDAIYYRILLSSVWETDRTNLVLYTKSKIKSNQRLTKLVLARQHHTACPAPQRTIYIYLAYSIFLATLQECI